MKVIPPARREAERANDHFGVMESPRAPKAYPARSTDTVVKYAEAIYLDWGETEFFADESMSRHWRNGDRPGWQPLGHTLQYIEPAKDPWDKRFRRVE